MIVKVSSKHQITIPKDIASAFNLKKGDVLDIKRKENKIVMVPKEVFFENKYPQDDLKAAEKMLAKGLGKDEIPFKSGSDMIKHLKKRIKRIKR